MKCGLIVACIVAFVNSASAQSELDKAQDEFINNPMTQRMVEYAMNEGCLAARSIGEECLVDAANKKMVTYSLDHTPVAQWQADAICTQMMRGFASILLPDDLDVETLQMFAPELVSKMNFAAGWSIYFMDSVTRLEQFHCTF